MEQLTPLDRATHDVEIIPPAELPPEAIPPEQTRPSSFDHTLRVRIVSLLKDRHPRLRRWVLGLFLSGLLVALGVWTYTHWQDPDRDLKLTNFLAAFLPFTISVFVAFIPDMEKSVGMRHAWRIGIVLSGGIYSLIVWHQQIITLASSRSDQTAIVRSAVQSADAHSDEQIQGVRKDLDGVRGEVAKVGEGLTKSTKHSDQRIDQLGSNLKTATDTFAAQVSKTESSLTKSIGAIILPPAKVGVLQFTFWTETASPKTPATMLSLSPDDGGVFDIPFTIANISDNTIHAADVWVDICSACSFADEPKGFEKTEGTSETTRHRPLELNPGANIAKQTLKVKFSGHTPMFAVGMRYSCEICGSMLNREAQIGVVTVTPKP